MSTTTPLHDAWLAALLGSELPRETRSTCDDCAMCGPPGQPVRDGAFDRQVKCCSYQPDIPNYLVGGVLQDVDARHADMRAAIARGIGVTPMGLAQPPAYAAVYREAAPAFGRAHALRCAWYVDEGSGQCGIWRHRPTVCATYFCKFERGAVSHAFWQAAKALLLELEHEVSLWCATQLDAAAALPGHRGGARGPIIATDLDGGLDARAHAALWGAWAGREAEYFVRCAELAATLAIDDVVTLAGPRLRMLATRLQSAHAALGTRQLPERLTMGNISLQPEAPGRVRVASYLATDPLVMPVTLATALLAFHGQPVSEANETLAQTQGVTLGAGLLQRLADFRVLVDAPAAGEGEDKRADGKVPGDTPG
jgi:Fe-S-cluster containining protein